MPAALVDSSTAAFTRSAYSGPGFEQHVKWGYAREPTPAQSVIMSLGSGPRRTHAARDLGNRNKRSPKGGHVKHSLRVIGFVTAISVMGAILPSASAQTEPAKSSPPPATQAQPEKNTGEKAKGAAKGAAIGAATGGSAAKGAVVGAGHSRREDRRTERKSK
jgi:hypothetical protein